MTLFDTPDRPTPHKREDDLLAALIAQGLTIKEAARRVGFSKRTAARRMADREFVAKVDSFRGRLVQDALSRLEGAMIGAADTLRDSLAHDEAHVRIRAAVEILKHAIRVKEHVELADRIARLESLLTRETP
jgi:hypothetical protein